MAHITRPFSLVLFLFYIYKKKIKQFLLSLIFSAIYFDWQYIQIGKVIIGQHPELTVGKLFSIKRLFLNLVYGAQSYFSIHNFSPINHLYQMDMIHLSPLITVMAVIGIFYFKKYFIDRKTFWTLFSFGFLVYLLPCSFFRMDMWYFGMFNFALIFLALPVLDKFKRLWPLIVFTFCFQFFYFFLSYRNLFWWPYGIFLIPFLILIMSMIFLPELEVNKD